MSRVFAWPEGKRAAVSLSFDDARVTQVTNGFPLLDGLGVRATFYVSFGNLEKHLDAWKRAIARGHEIGNHTVSHPCSGNFPWSRNNAIEDYTLERMEGEITGANERIQELLGVTPQTFAYPCGQKFVGRGESVRSTVPLVAKHFIAGRGFKDESPNDPLYADLSQLAAADSDGQTFEQYLEWMERAKITGGWLVFAGHDIGDGPVQTTQAAALEALCRYCLDPTNGIWLDTVAAVATHVRKARTAAV